MDIGIDPLDTQIIHELRQDGRLANTEIARRLGVSEATVRNRIQRLLGEGIIHVAAIVDPSHLGYELDVYFGIHCETARIEDVAHVLISMEEVRYLSYTAGRYDLLAAAYFRSRDELLTYLTARVGKIPGVKSAETLLVLRVAKRNALFGYWGSPPDA